MRTLPFLVVALFAPSFLCVAESWPAAVLEQDGARPAWMLELREVLAPDHPGYRQGRVVRYADEELRFGPALELPPWRAHLALDELGLPALGVGFAPLDSERLREWSTTRVGARIGAFVDGDLRTVARLQSELSGSLVVTGFEREEVLALVGDDPEARPYDLVLRVVDGRTGSPVEGASVEPPFDGRVRALGASRFEVRVERPKSLYRLEVTAPGYHPAVALASRGRDRLFDELVVEMLPPARLEGRVVDAAGDPVIGLRLSSSVSHPTAVAPRWASGLDRSWPHWELVTDGQGRFALADLPAGGHTLAVDGSGEGIDHPTRRWLGLFPRHLWLAPGATTHVLLRLPPRCAVTGQVVDEAGRPVANLAVALQPRRPGPGWPTLLADAQILDMLGAPRATTDEHGAFRFEAVPEGAYHLGTPPGGAAGAIAQPIQVDASSAGREQRLVAGRHSIEGRVEGDAGGTRILYVQPDGAPDDLVSWQERPVGPFRLGPFAPGRYRLGLSDGFVPGMPLGVEVFTVGQSGVVLRVPERAQLDIVPLLDGARHNARAWVESLGAGRAALYEELVGDPIEALPREQTLVVRSLDGYIGAARVAPRAGEQREVEVALERGAVLRVRVTSGVSRLRLEIGRGGMIHAALDVEPGVQEVLLVPAGSLALRLAHPDDGPISTLHLELVAGGDETIELHL